ncbi:hypothetical protein LSH36_204g03041 [Paralvinella palmiformis]|uniref:Uncharacterized protein n=1 Tax=Paralvinella palmiformis TaxID=53620 RepID=A0AAD9JQL5_9ANNE|nr:hypothetical protein LSH36_204g03041 [Paralvinella palmiformis]
MNGLCIRASKQIFQNRYISKRTIAISGTLLQRVLHDVDTLSIPNCTRRWLQRRQKNIDNT